MKMNASMELYHLILEIELEINSRRLEIEFLRND